jgi:predicted amidohydrolase
VKIGFAQLNTTVGDLPGNREKIIQAYRALVAQGAELVLTPELALTGYPPQDLVFKSRFVPANLEALDLLQEEVGAVPLLVGFIDVNRGAGQPFYNAAALLQAKAPRRVVHKSFLPTYDVFDEDRYFEPAASVEPLEIGGTKFGVTICEDIWTEDYLASGVAFRARRHGDPESQRLALHARQSGAPHRHAERHRPPASRADLLLQRGRRK